MCCSLCPWMTWFPQPLLVGKCSEPWLWCSVLNLLQFVLEQAVLSTGSVCSAEEVLRAALALPWLCTQELLPACARALRALWSSQVPSCRAAPAHCVLLQGIFPSQLWEFAFVFLEFHKVPVETFFSFSRTFWRAVQPLSVTIASPQFGTSNVLLEQYQKFLFYIFNLDCRLN